MAKIILFLFSFTLLAKEPFCELTIHSVPLNVKTFHHLAYLGIRCTFRTPFHPNLEIRPKPSWKEGIHFGADFNAKAKVFRKWIKIGKFSPSKTVILNLAHHPPKVDQHAADFE